MRQEMQKQEPVRQTTFLPDGGVRYEERDPNGEVEGWLRRIEAML